MKPGFFTALVCLLIPLAASAAEDTAETPNNPTAYTAMRVMQKQLGAETLSRIVEIGGRDGVPQPFLWKIVLKEGAGTREVDVAGGKIVAQRVVAKPGIAVLPTIRLQELNLDSSGAFDAADAQARKVRLRFDAINYTLRASEITSKPLWTLELQDKDGGGVGTMRLAAHDGTTLGIDGRLARNVDPIVVPPTEGTVSAGSTPLPAVVVEDDDEIGFFTRTGRTLDKANRTVQRNLKKAGATVQRFFTGRSDLDQPDNRN